jgi:hypothetical protein
MMMRRVLLILGALGTAGLIAAAGLGYSAPGTGEMRMRAHVLSSLAATLVVLFSHTWIVLYLLATGRVMSQAVREHGMDEEHRSGQGRPAGELLDRARRLRLAALPWLLAALAGVVVTFLLGGAAFGGPGWSRLHHALFYVTLALQIVAMRAELRVLAGHDALGVELARRLQADAA